VRQCLVLLASTGLVIGCGRDRVVLGGIGSTGNSTSGSSGSGSASSSGNGSTGGTANTTSGTSGTTETTTGGLLPAGANCDSDGQCQSDVCGVVHNGGDCCVGACATNDGGCGATRCDDAGACVYPDDMTQCTPATCVGGLVTAAFCDGMGHCETPTVSNCNDAGQFCDPVSGSCCSGLVGGGTLDVDAVTGNDQTACCGYGGSPACQTLSKAMALVDSAKAANVTIRATVDGGGGDWSAASETYPILLGWGVELSAPGVFFLDPNGGWTSTDTGPTITADFFIDFYSPSDTLGYASLVGSAAAQVGLGLNADSTQRTKNLAAISVRAGRTLYLANAVVNGTQFVIDVGAGSTLQLAQDQSGLVMGTVHIGNASNLTLLTQILGGGIICDDSSPGGCTIEDAVLPVGQSSVVIQGTSWGISLTADCVLSLTSSPVFGPPPLAAGFGECPFKPYEGAMIDTTGMANITIKNGTFQCIAGDAFQIRVGSQATIDNTLIQNTDTGIYAGGGTVTVTNSTLRYNYIGVLLEDIPGNASQVDLSGGGNTIICSDASESSNPNVTDPGVDVLNRGAENLNASNVAWDTANGDAGPDYFQCNSDFSICTCMLSSCTAEAGSQGMNAVEDSSDAGGITLTGATRSLNSCH
jgi:hypothetical protein